MGRLASSGTGYIIATPDGDVYLEEHEIDTPEIAVMRDSACQWPPPSGIPWGRIYRFSEEPTAEERRRWMSEARRVANEAYVRRGYVSEPPPGQALIALFPPGCQDRGVPAPPATAPPPPAAGSPPPTPASSGPAPGLAWLQGTVGPVAGSSGDAPARAPPPQLPPYPPPPAPGSGGLPTRPAPTFLWLDEDAPGLTPSGKLPTGFVWVAVECNPRAGVDVGDRIIVGEGDFFLMYVSLRRGIIRTRPGYDFFAGIAEHGRLHEVRGGMARL